MITEKSGVHSANVGLTNSFRKISNSFWWKNSKPLQLCCTHCITTAATTLPDCFSLLQWTLKWTWFYLSKYYAWLIDWLNPIFNASLNEQKQITYMRSVSCIWCFFTTGVECVDVLTWSLWIDSRWWKTSKVTRRAASTTRGRWQRWRCTHHKLNCNRNHHKNAKWHASLTDRH